MTEPMTDERLAELSKWWGYMAKGNPSDVVDLCTEVTRCHARIRELEAILDYVRPLTDDELKEATGSIKDPTPDKE